MATAISAPMKATLPRPGAASRSASLATKDATGPHREGNQEDAERHRRRPGRAEESSRQVLDDAERHRRDYHAGEAAQAAEHADREHPADIFAADRRLDRLDDDQRR